MSKLKSADKADGIPTPVNVANSPQAGNPSALRAAHNLLDNDFLGPLALGSEALEQLNELFRAIGDLTDLRRDGESDLRTKAVVAIGRIQKLAALGAYVSADLANVLDCEHEKARDESVPALLAMIGG